MQLLKRWLITLETLWGGFGWRTDLDTRSSVPHFLPQITTFSPKKPLPKKKK
tara:strand:+ start:623 stop:778 length:156 start_codon:yes stop_codon:yes gene_type:complete